MTMKARSHLSDVSGGAKDAPHGDAAWERVVTHGFQRHRPHTTATRAIGIATKLARRDLGFQIGRDIEGGPGKDALLG